MLKFTIKNMSPILIIIPARFGSKRLRKKNILPIKKLPMFVYVAKETLKSKFNVNVFVSSESLKIIDICKKYKIKIMMFGKSGFLINKSLHNWKKILDGKILNKKHNKKILIATLSSSHKVASTIDTLVIKNFSEKNENLEFRYV